MRTAVVVVIVVLDVIADEYEVMGASSLIDRHHRGHRWVTAVIRRLPR
jgi:aspartate aminotransferase-like enzyme